MYELCANCCQPSIFIFVNKTFRHSSLAASRCLHLRSVSGKSLSLNSQCLQVQDVRNRSMSYAPESPLAIQYIGGVILPTGSSVNGCEVVTESADECLCGFLIVKSVIQCFTVIIRCYNCSAVIGCALINDSK
ncbi:hypothetical protein UFOVP144_24 [uncultured Caudovirales phage]|uniref:Uncharacterized protein n=1 Tax=uncultured Caudovirales phage TaxID=2100421 RepID=A0A6J7XR06_9CAUD|nr:hypothetical protein UFOVP144_24 [uncultured Caudovirales phage]